MRGHESQYTIPFKKQTQKSFRAKLAMATDRFVRAVRHNTRRSDLKELFDLRRSAAGVLGSDPKNRDVEGGQYISSLHDTILRCSKERKPR